MTAEAVKANAGQSEMRSVEPAPLVGFEPPDPSS